MKRNLSQALVVATLLLLSLTLGAAAQTPSPTPPDGGWPRQFPGSPTLYLFQPQVDSWNGVQLAGHAAVKTNEKTPHFGVVWFTTQTETMKDARMVLLYTFTITRSQFPGATPAQAAAWQARLQQAYQGKVTTYSLDRLQASLVAAGVTPPAAPVAVQNTPPRLLFSTTPAMLVRVYGAPVLKPVGTTSGQRVVNTPALIVTDGTSWYLYLSNQWLQASAVDGTYGTCTNAPAFLDTALQNAKQAKNADLFLDPGPTLKTALQNGNLPTVYVSTVPTELVVTQGPPRLQNVKGTSLQEVANTKSDLFFDKTSQTWYMLAAGRWFSSSSLGQSWTYVAGAQLPADFAKIPPTDPKGAVLVSVPQTPEAQEAVIAAQIPQTATINRSAAKFKAYYDGGSPSFQPIAGTSLQYAANSGTPVIQVSPSLYYALSSGVWFTAPSPSGPWTVATSVPKVIYTIPPSSPLYQVTYVKVYGSTTDVVYTGYTPGYYGTIVGSDGTVVYGTGYDYTPYVGSSSFIAPPMTYGPAAGYFWGTATGYLLGAATSALWGPGWGYGWGDYSTPYWGGAVGTPYWSGAYAAGAYGGAWAAASDAYRNWGDAAYRGVTGAYSNAWTGAYGNVNRGVAYNARTGAYTAGTRVTGTNPYTGFSGSAAQGLHYNPTTGNLTAARGGTVTNPYTGKTSGAIHGDTYHPATGTTSSWGAAKVGNQYYASRDGNVYHANGNSWSHYAGGGWGDAGHYGGFDSGYFNREAAGRSVADDRWGSFAHSGGWGDRFGGGFHGGWGGGSFGGFHAGGFGGFHGGFRR